MRNSETHEVSALGKWFFRGTLEECDNFIKKSKGILRSHNKFVITKIKCSKQQ